jgi:hypothetical protein
MRRRWAESNRHLQIQNLKVVQNTIYAKPHAARRKPQATWPAGQATTCRSCRTRAFAIGVPAETPLTWGSGRSVYCSGGPAFSAPQIPGPQDVAVPVLNGTARYRKLNQGYQISMFEWPSTLPEMPINHEIAGI